MIAPAGAAVVVGVDGSESSLQAATVAARLAAERDRPLRVVHAFIWPEPRVRLPAAGGLAGGGPPDGGLADGGLADGGPADGGLANRAERVVADAVPVAAKAAPELGISGEVIVGAATAVLLHEAHDAALVVVGDRGLGGFTGLLVGSVAVQLAAHAPCPVVVARGDMDRRGDVLVGVDGSAKGQQALAFAFEEAALRGAGLTALHAYVHPVTSVPGDMLPLVYDQEQLAAEEAAVLAESLAGWGERYPDVPVRPLVVRERTAGALVRAAEQARMVVVGSRGRGGFTGLLLGSVSQAVLHHASCPVAIVR